MKSIANKKTILAVSLISSTSALWAANGSAGVPVNDTTIFSFFVLCAVIFMMIIYAQINAVKSILENRNLWLGGDNKSGNGEKAAAIIGALVLSQGLYAQDANPEPLITMTKEMYWILLSLNAFLLGIIITLYYVINGLIKALKGQEAEESAPSPVMAALTDAVPIERESEVLLDHDYDGIKELDNNLPPWWKYGFYFTIVFAVVYLIHYHVTRTGDLQLVEYEKEMTIAAAEIEAFKATQANLVDESNLMAVTESARLESGKKVFMDNCKICHGEYGEGMVGPNLTDQYWKHGGGIKEIYNTIKVGVAEKGMISWESQLTPAQRLDVSSYILTLQGTNPPNQKAPEGDLWEEESPAAEPEESSEETPEDSLEETTEEGDQSTTSEEEKV
jgi:cytochrome c oxidase cbb3-type subunit 3